MPSFHGSDVMHCFKTLQLAFLFVWLFSGRPHHHILISFFLKKKKLLCFFTKYQISNGKEKEKEKRTESLISTS
jgi:hypothetical protein